MERAEAAALFTPHAAEALEAFGVRPTRLELVSLSENVTFRVETTSPEETYALRLHRPGYNTRAELLSERTDRGHCSDNCLHSEHQLRRNSEVLFQHPTRSEIGNG